MAKKTKLRGTHCILPVERIAPDPRNHNTMSADEYNKLVASIRDHGFLDPLLVRQKASKGGKTHETINGEHRLRAAQDAGLEEVTCNDLGKVTDLEAEQLAIITNELSGSSDPVRLSERLRRLNDDVPFEKLAATMPYHKRELQMLIEVVDFSFANLSTRDTREAEESEEAAAADEKWLKFKFTKARADRVLALLEKLEPGDPAAALERCVKEHAKAKGIRLGSAASSKARKVRRPKPKKEAIT